MDKVKILQHTQANRNNLGGNLEDNSKLNGGKS